MMSGSSRVQTVLAPGREAVAARAQPGISQAVVDDAGQRAHRVGTVGEWCASSDSS